MGLSLDLTDYIIVLGLGFISAGYFIYKNSTPKPSAAESHLAQLSKTLAEQKSRQLAAQAAKPTYDGLADQMSKTDKNIVIFFGSQTGTTEDFASRLEKEANGYGFKAMTADPEEFDMQDLESLPEDKLAVFIMATYGEGEPTDNAQPFHEFLESSVEERRDDAPMSTLSYAIFGAGNKTYEHFNSEARFVDNSLTQLGATRIGERGEGDDDANIEEDFVTWKATVFIQVCEFFKVDPSVLQKRVAAQKAFTLTELPVGSIPKTIYKGELKEATSAERLNSVNTVYDLKNPFYAPIRVSHELFNQDLQKEGEDLKRHCLHQEIDITGSGMKYQAGDHVGIWPTNEEDQVKKVAKVLGLLEKDADGTLRLDKAITMTADDPNARKKHPFPCPTTYRTAFRHYLDISLPVKAHNLDLFLSYVKASSTGTNADVEKVKDRFSQLIDDKAMYHKQIVEPHVTVADILDEHPEVTMDVGAVLESFSRLQCRYYSISSSGKVFPNNVHITASVLRYESKGKKPRVVKGVCTNYLYELHEKLLAGADPDDIRIPCYIRHSNFHLPRDSSPVIMIGPGTGVAPFRGFVQDIAFDKSGKNADVVRAAASVTKAASQQNGNITQNGVTATGESRLFYGCRYSSVDFLYQHEWSQYQALGGLAKLYTAFSRDSGKKVYVQDRLRENKADIWSLLTEKKGFIYVCGDAKNMAREVNQFFVDLAKDELNLSDEKAHDWVKEMRSTGRYLEDVWS